MNETQTLTRAAELESLAHFRTFIQSICATHPGVDSQTIYELQLAVDEACTNIITHGYADMNPGSIILEIKFEPKNIVITLTDFGHPFEPIETPAPDLEAVMRDEPTSGFGLFIIYQTMDEVSYRTSAFGNQLILTKRFL